MIKIKTYNLQFIVPYMEHLELYVGDSEDDAKQIVTEYVESGNASEHPENYFTLSVWENGRRIGFEEFKFDKLEWVLKIGDETSLEFWKKWYWNEEED